MTEQLATPGPTGDAVARRRVPNLSRDLMRQVANDHGGDGTINAFRAYERTTPAAQIAFIDLVTMPPASSIGLHRHGDDNETYVILSGRGTMALDGEEFRVSTGDVVVNRPYGEHGLRNDSTDELHLLVFESVPGSRSRSAGEGPAAG
jgi:mannose-6-phosphate isomerase-like protein (cupin superfamily)